jgi:1,4-dihydroxy-2-naphthoate octaprenyltransferase
MSDRIKIWVQAFRLRTLPLALSSTLVGSFLAWSFDAFRLIVLLLAMLTTLFLQILSNLANDYGDSENGADNELRVGPERVTQSGKVSKQAIKQMIVIFAVLAFISGSFLIVVGLQHLPLYNTILFFVLGLSAILASIKYTVGKNPYGYQGFGDVFVYIFFGLVGVCGTFYLHTGFLNPWILLPASSIGLLSSGVLNLNNLRDINSDTATGKKTLVVRIGERAAKLYHVLLLYTAVALSLVYNAVFYKSPFQFLFLLTLPFLLHHIGIVLQNTKPSELNNELKRLALTTFAFAILFSIGLIL